MLLVTLQDSNGAPGTETTMRRGRRRLWVVLVMAELLVAAQVRKPLDLFHRPSGNAAGCLTNSRTTGFERGIIQRTGSDNSGGDGVFVDSIVD